MICPRCQKDYFAVADLRAVLRDMPDDWELGLNLMNRLAVFAMEQCDSSVVGVIDLKTGYYEDLRP